MDIVAVRRRWKWICSFDLMVGRRRGLLLRVWIEIGMEVAMIMMWVGDRGRVGRFVW